MHPDNNIVGRGAELTVLSGALQSLGEGHGQVLLLSGEPGIGKSTLVQKLADDAKTQGLPVYWGFTWESGGAPTYWPWTQLLRSLIKEQSVASDLTTQLGRIVPECADAGSEAMTLQPDQAHFLLLESVRMLFKSVSNKTPLVLILEDLHAADSDSLQLLRYLASHTRNMPILLAGTYRDQEARSSDATGPLWQTTRDARVLQLSRLSAEDVSQYLDKRHGEKPDIDEVQDLLAITEGNPLFLSELVVLLETDGSAGEGSLPQTVEQVIQQQLERLPGESHGLLAIASVLGREFSHRAIADLSGHTGPELDKLLDPAIAGGIISTVAAGQYRFFHVLYREVLRERLKRNQREDLHRRHAETLKTLIAEGDPDRWSELATHLDAAGPGNRAEAISAWRKAAERATERLAFEAAESELQKALDEFGSGPNYDPADRCLLLLELANATLTKGDIEKGQQLCREAYAIAKTLEDGELMAQSALTWGSVIVVAKVNKDLVNALEEALEHLSQEEVGLCARVSARLAAALQPAPNPAVPVEMAREAIALARTTGDDRVVYEVLRHAISAMMP